MRSRFVLAAVCGIAFAFGQPAFAQGFKPDTVNMAAAKKEGTLSWYTSTPVRLAQALANKFTEETGIKVQLLRTGGSAVLRRILTEIKAGNPGADVITFSNAAAANDMAGQGLYAAFKPEGFDKVLDSAKDPQGRWIAQRVQILGMPYRTDKIKGADIPKKWTDLADPKYKGKMVMPDPNFTAIQVIIVSTLARKYGWGFYKALRKNNTMIVRGHHQVFQTLQTGERVLGAEGAPPRTYNKGKKVPNQSIVYPADGAFLVCSPMAILKSAKHPNAARAFVQWTFSKEAQNMIAHSGIPSSRVDVAPPAGEPALAKLKSFPIDYAYVEKNTRHTKDTFSEIFE